MANVLPVVEINLPTLTLVADLISENLDKI
jgi:hypothetical protein